MSVLLKALGHRNKKKIKTSDKTEEGPKAEWSTPKSSLNPKAVSLINTA